MGAEKYAGSHVACVMLVAGVYSGSTTHSSALLAGGTCQTVGVSHTHLLQACDESLLVCDGLLECCQGVLVGLLVNYKLAL